MTHTLFATKHEMTEAYLGDTRVAVTRLVLCDSQVVREKSVDKDGYQASVVTFKKAHGKKSYTREIISSDVALLTGTFVNVQSTSKGKGTAGVMKRWGFAGGPRTHGQSDRARAPGSIGQGTTPGRVLKGRHMAGRMGNATTTVRNLQIVALDQAKNTLWLSGPVPGHIGALVKISVQDKEVAKLPEINFLKGYNQSI